jgi:hypothetical protein
VFASSALRVLLANQLCLHADIMHFDQAWLLEAMALLGLVLQFGSHTIMYLILLQPVVTT